MAETLIGNYRILSELARGSFGRVYLAQHAVLTNRTVALKLMQSVPLQAAEERAQFLHEARILEVLHHPYILPVIDVGLHEGVPYIVSEYAAQGSLRQRLRQIAPQLLSQEVVLTLLCQIGQALHFVHQNNIIHRDLKPENILFNTRGDALLADFGLAAMLSTASMTFVSGAGTPHYMAPEQFQGMISRESDQYALGCIAYELFTGQHLFAVNETIALAYKHTTEIPLAPSFYNPTIPPHIEQAIMRALAKQREARHADVLSFLLAMVPSGQFQQTTTLQINAISTSLNGLSSHPSGDGVLALATPVNPSSALPVAGSSLMRPSFSQQGSTALLSGNGMPDAMSTMVRPTSNSNGGAWTMPMPTERANALAEQTYLLSSQMPQASTQLLLSPLARVTPPQGPPLTLPQGPALSGYPAHRSRRWFLLASVIVLLLIALVAAVTLPLSLHLFSRSNGNQSIARGGATVTAGETGGGHPQTTGGTQGTQQPGTKGNGTGVGTTPTGQPTTPAGATATAKPTSIPGGTPGASPTAGVSPTQGMTPTPTAGVTPTPTPTSGPSPTPNVVPLLGVNPTSLDASTSCGNYLAGQGWQCSLALSGSQGSSGTLSWSATVNDPGGATGVTLSSTSGSVGSQQGEILIITVPGNVCPAQANITFSSANNSVNVPVSCDAPIISTTTVVCSGKLSSPPSTCTTSITSSNAGFKWSSVVSGGTATFSPASGIYNPANGPLQVTISVSLCSSISIRFAFIGPANTANNIVFCAT